MSNFAGAVFMSVSGMENRVTLIDGVHGQIVNKITKILYCAAISAALC